MLQSLQGQGIFCSGDRTLGGRIQERAGLCLLGCYGLGQDQRASLGRRLADKRSQIGRGAREGLTVLLPGSVYRQPIETVSLFYR